MRLIAFMTALSLAGCVGAEPVTSSRPVALTPSQLAVIKNTASYDLLDPSSATFRNIRAADVTLQSGKTIRRVCGEVNAKNSLGGYAGYAMFGGELVSGQFQKQDFFGPCGV